MGDVAAFSFCQDKIITTGGEGGMVTTNRHDLIEGPLAKAAIEKMRIEGRYAPDIIAEALLRLQGDWKC